MINPTTDTITEFATSNLYPYGITAGPDGKLWFTGSGQIGQINPTTDVITEYAIPYAGSSTRGSRGPGRQPLVHRQRDQLDRRRHSDHEPIGRDDAAAGQRHRGQRFRPDRHGRGQLGQPDQPFNGTVTVALATIPAAPPSAARFRQPRPSGVATFSGLSSTRPPPATRSRPPAAASAGRHRRHHHDPAAATQLVITTQPPSRSR